MFAASKTDQNVAGGPPPSGDPYWSNVSLLTNFENNLTFQDESTNNFAITRNGVVNPSLNTPFSGGVGGSEKFNGTTGYLTTPNNIAFNFGAGDFTIEGWIYRADANIRGIFQLSTTAGGLSTTNLGLAIGSDVGQVWRIYANNTAYNATATWAINTWYHFALVKTAGNIKLYINGTSVITQADTTNYAGQDLCIGGFYSTTYLMNGNTSNFRIVKGTAVYTANFTPPTAPLTAITNTSLLITGTGQGMFNNSTFVDQGPNALTVTATGAPVYSGLSPFGNTYPGSVLFSGTGQYLTVPLNAALNPGTGDFTLEYWVYFNALNTGNQYNAQTGGIGIGLDGSNRFLLGQSYVSNLIADTVAVTTGQWYHVAVSRSGTTLSMFVNGSRRGSISNSTNFSTTLENRIGWNGGAAYFSGYLSNLRIVKGTAVYDPTLTTLTVPTAPLTAITNTSLLVRGDTGAFYDLSNNGNGMTSTGTTEVTTQFKQFGSESGVYTGTGRQSVTNATNLQFGSGDYTIEAWVYRPSATLLRTLLSKGGAATGWLLQINSSQQVIFTVTSTIILTSTTTITAGTWTHVAITRSGTSTRLFVGGNLEATATDSTAFSQTENLSIGVDRSNTSGLNGYLDDIRITKGVARYTATFTPPTATFPTA